MGILLLHSGEHFDFYVFPPNEPGWLQALDHRVFATVSFLFAGKSYAIFAMLFGLSFFLLLDRSARRGVNFRWRFLWRLTVLGVIGYVHSILYCGDILTILAVLGIPLVWLYALSNRTLAWLSALLLLQLPFLWQLARIYFQPGYAPPPTHFGAYYGAIYPAFAEGGILDVFRANLVDGQLAKWWWMIDNGRWLQMAALFACGLILGRKRVFENPSVYVRLAWQALVIGVFAFALTYFAQEHLRTAVPRGPVHRLAVTTMESYVHLAQMLVWVGGFILLYHYTRLRVLLRLLIPFGRMSLTCYVTQALFWVPVYYNFGFGLYRELGQFYSILAGAGFFVLQLAAAHWWLQRFHYGPLEWLWRSATLGSWTTPFRRPPAVAAEPAQAVANCATP